MTKCVFYYIFPPITPDETDGRCSKPIWQEVRGRRTGNDVITGYWSTQSIRARKYERGHVLICLFVFFNSSFEFDLNYFFGTLQCSNAWFTEFYLLVWSMMLQKVNVSRLRINKHLLKSRSRVSLVYQNVTLCLIMESELLRFTE